MAGPTGLEPATSGVTGQRSNQLNYGPMIKKLRTQIPHYRIVSSKSSRIIVQIRKRIKCQRLPPTATSKSPNSVLSSERKRQS